MLGRTQAVSFGRRVLAAAPRLGLGPRADRRPMGVSALVRVKNEEAWIEPSLRSLEGFADEIVVVDNGSTDTTVERVRALAGSLRAELRLELAPQLDHRALSNRVLELARFRWLIRWDADCIAHTSGPHALSRLRGVLDHVPPWRHVCIYPAMVEVDGDLFHQRPEVSARYDTHVVTWSPALTYRMERVPTADGLAAVEFLHLPWYYEVRRWETSSIFHVNVKSPRRMLLRRFWQQWWAEAPGCSLEDYALARMRASDVGDLDTAARRHVQDYCRDLRRFDPVPHGGYPELLAAAVAAPGVRLLYRDGRIVGRSDVGEAEEPRARAR